MRFHFNSNIISWFFVCFMPIALASLFWQIALFAFALPLQQEKLVNSLDLKSVISFSSLFSTDKINKKAIKKNTSILNANTFKLKALYEDDSGGFIILEAKGKIDFVSLNEIYEGFTLSEIFSDYAILKKNGKEYTLSLYETKKEREIPKEIDTDEESKIQNVQTLKRSELEPFQKDIKTLWRNIRLQPYNIDNELTGYKVSFIKRNSLFQQIGLKKGDTLQSINGIDVKDTAKVMEMYGSLDSYDSLQLEIIRNQEAKDLYYELN